MKKNILDLSGNKGLPLPLDAAISFNPFIDYLRRRVAGEKTAKAGIYKNALALFEKHNVQNLDLTLENIHEYEELLEQMYVCLSPPLADENEVAWGLGFPFQPVIFYGTAMLFELMHGTVADQDKYVVTKTPEQYHQNRLQLVYSFILQRLYNFRIPVPVEQYHAGVNTETGLLQYFAVHINTDFLQVEPVGELPTPDFTELSVRLAEEEGYGVFEKMMPLSMFRFRGITMVTISDVTAEKAVENIESVRLARTPDNDETSYQHVIQSLKTIVRNKTIEFDLFPLVTVNNEPVYGYRKGGTGILFDVWGERLSPEVFRKQAKGYFSNPNSFFSKDIFGPKEIEIPFLDHFRKLKVRSLALLPVFYNRQPVGVVAMHTWENNTFDETVVSLLEPALAALGSLMQVYIDEFNLEIENIIKEKFTSIQPSVQWKFNEVAWHYLHDRKRGLPEKAETIHFNDVFPLYGAVDIRNSTLERNKAIISDLDSHLSLLMNTLTALQLQHQSVLQEEMIYKCSKWKEVLKQEQLNGSDENKLVTFFKEETTPYLTHLSKHNGNNELLTGYMLALEKFNSNVYGNKHALELSMQMINNVVNNYFESEKDQLQRSYPCYFEKFRTDGVEYDIYIGQAFAPNHPFNHFHLKNLRLWQLSSMAAVAQLTAALLPEMPIPLRTTQLIFVHNHTIDISFRADERKFDVEGAYNIRYQMIKKRIDKVHIHHSEERLTQPDKIVLIYFDRKDIEDYLPFIHYLQEKGTLNDDLEELELEDLQGLAGLRALRVGVTPGNFDEMSKVRLTN
ncbi:GAF domain-containing protein [Chitinophaga filiformis]|uniref:GAF domain-containing protein n=1 Tax=Chitinophaga filiformis TaxID=104663 RepID=UPI001F208DCD|nr:GAF domain-containing protein [Chitinophaga filiformis]MCF6402569.1 GAF domain-containing protein [Chitinophaga filiformis]MCF6403513.1 GAF domain-containing protein [Chitinophaga filiformis]